ncbi:MAG: flagellar biosynthetic protein FliO [Armatimonadetes bacterium]|nr:flagellar biosynthetic protein FliO [Armatimonadota bacterium]
MKTLLVVKCLLYVLMAACSCGRVLSAGAAESQGINDSGAALTTAIDAQADNATSDNLDSLDKSSQETPVIIPIIPEDKKATPAVSVSEVTEPRKAKEEGRRSKPVRRAPLYPASVVVQINDSQTSKRAEPSPYVIEKKRPDKIALLSNYQRTNREPAKKETSTIAVVLSMVLKLSIVLGLAYFTILLLKWVSSRRNLLPNNHDLKMVASAKLSANSTLHIVNVRGKSLLIGCGGGQVSLLCDLGDVSEEGLSQSNGLFMEYLEKYSKEEARHGPAGRIAGLLRDCTAYLRERSHVFARASGRGVNDEG